MTKYAQNFTVFAGNTKKVKITVYDEDGALLSLIGVQAIHWVLRNHVVSSEILIDKSLGSGVTVLDEDNGLFQVTLDAADTEDLRLGDYYHEAEVTDASGNIETVAVGTVTIEDSAA